MTKISTSLYEFANDTFKSVGLGNSAVLGTFALLLLLTTLAMIGSTFPILAASMSWLVALATFGATFIGISLLTALNPVGIFFGLVTGSIMASLSSAICALTLYLAPPVTLLIAFPNAVAGVAFALGALCSFVETCFETIANCFERKREPVYHPRVPRECEPAVPLRRINNPNGQERAFWEAPARPPGGVFVHPEAEQVEGYRRW